MLSESHIDAEEEKRFWGAVVEFSLLGDAEEIGGLESTGTDSFRGEIRENVDSTTLPRRRPFTKIPVSLILITVRLVPA